MYSPTTPLEHRWGLIDILCCQVPHGGAISFGQTLHDKDQIPGIQFDIIVFYLIRVYVVGQMPQSGANVCCQISHYSPTCARSEEYIHEWC